MEKYYNISRIGKLEGRSASTRSRKLVVIISESVVCHSLPPAKYFSVTPLGYLDLNNG